MTRKAPRGAIHYPLAAATVRRVGVRQAPGDLTAEEMLELDDPDPDPDESRYYAGMVAGGWGLLAFVFGVAIVLSVPVGLLLGDQAGSFVAAACVAAGFFCIAGSANTLWHIAWHVPKHATASEITAPTAWPSRPPCAAASPGTPASCSFQILSQSSYSSSRCSTALRRSEHSMHPAVADMVLG
jgi:hypothetical protein